MPAAAAAQQEPQQTDDQVALLRNLLEQMRNDMTARDEDHRRREDDLRKDRDHWREAFLAEQRQLPAPAQPDALLGNTPSNMAVADSGWRRAWRWMRKTA
jgi:hypothetical protein